MVSRRRDFHDNIRRGLGMDAALRSIALGAKNALVGAAVMLVVAVALWWGLFMLAESAEQQQQAAEAARDSALQEREQRRRDLVDIEGGLQDWRRWQATGLIGPGDRAGWFEAANAVRVGTMPAPELTLEPAQPLAAHPGAAVHRLEAKFEGVVEPEVLMWLARARQNITTAARLERLAFERSGGDLDSSAQVSGLAATLTLALFHFDPSDVEKFDAAPEVNGASMRIR